MKRKPYPSDVTDAQWAILQPLIPAARRGGRPRKTDMRAVLDALFYHTREGGSWRALPHDFPPWKTVYNYFQWWTWDGTWQKLLDALHPRARAAAGRHPIPSAAAIDSQSARQPRAARRAARTAGRRSAAASATSWWTRWGC
jgi:putative transposase